MACLHAPDLQEPRDLRPLTSAALRANRAFLVQQRQGHVDDRVWREAGPSHGGTP